jgi:ubiquinone biosynthesis protein UbiJ
MELKRCVTLIVAALFLIAADAAGQGKGPEKKLNKEARKLASAAEEAAEQIGRDSVFCVLAAHTDVFDDETLTLKQEAQKLKEIFESLDGALPFGQFVAAVLMADRTDLKLQDILEKLKEGQSIGQIAKQADVNMGELRRHFGQFRSELARAMTHPPSKCLSSS